MENKHTNNDQSTKHGVNRTLPTIEIDISRMLLFLVGIILISTFLFYFITSNKKDKYEKQDEVLANLAVECEQGNPVTFPIDPKIQKHFVKKENLTGTFTLDTTIDDVDRLTDKEHKMVLYTHPDYSLIFYNNRKVQIDGFQVKSKDNKEHIYVEKIKCIGKETNKETRNTREEIIKFINGNKQKIYEKQGYSGQVEIYNIGFVENENEEKGKQSNNVVYVTFSPETEEDAPDIILLLKFDNLKNYQVLARYTFDEKGQKLVFGQDNYKDKKVVFYEYDDELNRWVLAW